MFRNGGIGLTTINRIQESAAPARGIGFYDALSAPGSLFPGSDAAHRKLDSFASFDRIF